MSSPGDWSLPGDKAEVPEKELIVTEPIVTFGRDTVRVKFCEKPNIITSAKVINKKEGPMEHFQPLKLTQERINGNDKVLQEIQQVMQENQTMLDELAEETHGQGDTYETLEWYQLAHNLNQVKCFVVRKRGSPNWM